MTKKKKSVIQTHHLSYNPEVTVTMYKGEHMLLDKPMGGLNRRTHISKGFIRALKVWIILHEDEAVDLKVEDVGEKEK